MTKELEELSKLEQGASGNKEGVIKSGMKGGNGGNGEGAGGLKEKKAVRIRDPEEREEWDGRERREGGLDGRERRESGLDGRQSDQQRYLDVITTEDNVSDALESGYQSTILPDKQSDTVSKQSDTARRRSNDFELSESYL